MANKATPEILFNRQVNYLIIEKMWEYKNKGIDKSIFYSLIGINKNMYTRIRTADTYDCPNLNNKWESPNSSLRKTGLSLEIMTGLEMIEVEGISKEDWKKYLKYRYDKNDKSYYRTSYMRTVNKKLKTVFDGLDMDKKDKRAINKLMYFFTYGRAIDLDIPDKEMLDLRESLNNVTINKIKACDKKLRYEIYTALKEKYEQMKIIIRYESL